MAISDPNKISTTSYGTFSPMDAVLSDKDIANLGTRVQNTGGFSSGGGFRDFLGGLFGGLFGGSGGGGVSNLLGTGAGALLAREAYKRLGDIGDTAMTGAEDIAQRGLEQTQFRPFTVTTSTGGMFGVDPQGGTTMTVSPEEQALREQLFGQAGQFFQTPTGVDTLTQAGLAAAGLGREELGQQAFGIDPTRAASQQAFGLGGQFMEAAGMPTADREAAIYERMRATMAPEERRQQLALEERLASQGRLGVRTAQFGGAPEQFAMAQAQEEARNRAMLGAMQQAQAEQAQQAGLGAQYSGLGTSLAGQQAGLQSAQQARALQALQASQGLLSGGLGLQQQGQQLGQGALGASYIPQAQLLAATQPAMTTAQLAQRGQLEGAGLFGEAQMSGLEALLSSGLGQANLFGQIGTGLLSQSLQPMLQRPSTEDQVKQALIEKLIGG